MWEDKSKRELKKKIEKRLELGRVIERYLDYYVKIPVLDTIEKDFDAQDRIANLLLILGKIINQIMRQGLDFDKNFLKQLSQTEVERRMHVLREFIRSGNLSQEAIEILRFDSSRKNLLVYLGREINWVAISILSASYISANILMRSILELLIGIATKKTGGKMRDRIEEISFLLNEEKEQVLELWKELNKWAHPYGKWTKEVCPIYVSQEPMYHHNLSHQSLEKLEKLVDVLLTIALENFEIDGRSIRNIIKKYRINTSDLTLFRAHATFEI